MTIGKKLWVRMAAILILSMIVNVFGICQPQEAQAAKKKNKILVVYFTRQENIRNPEKLDATSSASINLSSGKRVGNAEYIARQMKKETGADIVAVKVKKKYTNSYDGLVDIAEKEQEEDARPKIVKSSKKLKKYDKIILCYPVWWETMPMALQTYLENNQWKGKKVYAFAANAGSGFSDSIADMKKLCKGAKIKRGFNVYEDSVLTKNTLKKIKKWAKKIKAA